MKTKVAVVIPNWNGKDVLEACLGSLLKQTISPEIIVVDNGSVDGSVEFIQKMFPKITLLQNAKNLGFAGGVNTGIRYAIKNNHEFVALFNNDAVADKKWLEHLVKSLNDNQKLGIVTGKFLKTDRRNIDSTGDLYTSWGLPFPRARDKIDNKQFDKPEMVFGASGGASLYRTKMFQKIGLFDEDFFAYFEDIDLSFRAQLCGWKIQYVPNALAYHEVGGTSSKLKGFTTYQTLKNLPWVYWKNVPLSIALPMFPKIFFAYWSIFVSAVLKGNILPAIRGAVVCHLLMPKKLFIERYKIMRMKSVSNTYIRSIIYKGPPPNASKLLLIRRLFVWK